MINYGDKLVIRDVEDPRDAIKWVKERRKKLKSKTAKLGDLVKVDLEEEFNRDPRCCQSK